MRWLTFTLVAAMLLAMQSVLAPRLELFGARADWMLAAVVFFALYAPPRDALLGAWLMGLGADLMSIERFGLIGLSYLSAAVIVVFLRAHVYRGYVVAQFAVTLFACLMVRAGWMLYHRIEYGAMDPLGQTIVTDVLLVSIYTAAWAPLLHGLLIRLSRTFGVALPRQACGPRSIRGLARV